MSDDTPEVIRELVEGCQRFVKNALSIELDHDPETLPILDHYLAGAREGDEPPSDEVIGLLATAAGAYFGEVVRRQIDGARWHLGDPADAASWRIELDHVFLAFNPVGMAREAIAAEAVEGWSAHLEMRPRERDLVAQTLERLGEVEARDYFRLAMRWEVIEQAVAVLESAAQARGEATQRFPPSTYAAALDSDG